MEMVIAFIKPHKFDDVMLALHKIDGLTGASASDVRGFGRDRPKSHTVKCPSFIPLRPLLGRQYGFHIGYTLAPYYNLAENTNKIDTRMTPNVYDAKTSKKGSPQKVNSIF